MSKVVSKVVAAAMLMFGTIAGAASIQFDFTGVVTDDAINGCGGLVACGAVSGSYVFDSAAPDGNAAADAGLYEAIGISFFIDGSLFFSAANGSINVVNGALADQYGLLALSGSAANGSAADLSILLQDFTASAFASAALPLTPDLLAALLSGVFTLNAGDDSFQLLGSITSIACSSGCGGGQIAEPASLWLLAVGLVLLGLLRRRAIAPG